MSEAEEKAREVYQQLQDWIRYRENTISAIHDITKSVTISLIHARNWNIFKGYVDASCGAINVLTGEKQHVKLMKMY